MNTLTLLKKFIIAECVERDYEKALSFLTQDIHWLGTADWEECRSLEEARTYLIGEMKAMPKPYDLQIFDEVYIPLAEGVGEAFLQVMVENFGVKLKVRISAVSRIEDGEVKLCAMHFSVADEKQQDGEYFPVQTYKEQMLQKRHELVVSTMAGGLLGGYIKPDFPFYFVSQQLLAYLGYDTEAEFVADIKGLIINGIHPEERERIKQEVEQQLGLGDKYAVDYRMKKKDGSYIWVHDIGQQTIDEQGNPVIISVCYDITQSRIKQNRLEQVVHNVPSGICLYKWDGVRLHLLVASKQFAHMIGREIPEFSFQVMDKRIYANIHPADRAGLQSASQRALETAGSCEYTYRIFNAKLQQYIWLYAQGNVVVEADGTRLIYVSYTDITEERLNAQRLSASERALDAATEQAGLWYWKYYPEKNQAYFNPRCMRDFNLPQILENYPEAWLDKNWIAPAYVKVYADAVAKIKAGATQVVFEAQVIFLDKITHWAEFRFTRIVDKESEEDTIICTGRLIDFEKDLLAKYELEKQKPSLGEQDLLIHGIFNLDTGLVVNHEASIRLGYDECYYTTMTEVIAAVAENIVGEKDKEEFLQLNNREYLKMQFAQGKVDFAMDYRRKIGNRQIIWVRNILHLVREPGTGVFLLFEYCYDIHKQKMAEEVLRTATIYDYEHIASVNFDIGKMIYYGSDGEILLAEKLLDYEVSCLAYAKKLISTEEQEAFLNNINPLKVKAMVAKAGVYSFTAKACNSQGKNKIIKVRFVPYDLENDIYIMTSTDVSVLLQEEEAKNKTLSEALAVAEQANQAKTSFLAAMSHDIRTPMNAIVGMCQLALEDEKDYVQVHESLKTIQSSSQLLLALINNILDMSRIESGKMLLVDQPFSLLEQVHDTAASCKVLTIQKQQNFQLSINITHDICNGDIARIYSAIDNILSNAIKYTPMGGTITYRVAEIPYNKTGIGLYRFEISDTGIGFNEKEQQHLFEPFYRGNKEFVAQIEGTGLGLSIAKAIIELKGGTISVKSTEGVGTTFVVELPLNFAKAEDLPMALASEPKICKRRRFNRNAYFIV